MYKISTNPQRSPEWFEDRKGKITMSIMDRIITSTGKKSASSEDVINRLVAEMIAGVPDDTFQSEAMLRGSELESEALAHINFVYGYNFQPVGFFDSKLGFGCSPDGWDFDRDIGIQLKCPMLHTHLKYLSGEVLPKDYKQQVLGELMVTGAKKWIFASYYPNLPSLVVEVERDEAFIGAMKEITLECCKEIQERLTKLNEILKAS